MNHVCRKFSFFAAFVMGGSLPACSHLDGANTGESRYVFQYSVLNFSKVPEFPKRFLSPEVTSSRAPQTYAASQPVGSTPEVDTMKIEGGDSPEISAFQFSPTDRVFVSDQSAHAAGSLSESGRAKYSGSETNDLDDILGVEGEDVELAAYVPGVESISGFENGLESPSGRGKAVSSAQEWARLGKSMTSEEFLKNVLEVGDAGKPSGEGLRGVYKSFRSQGLTFDTEEPTPGDLIFFHNTQDANKDGRNNDWYSACGIAVSVENDGTIRFVSAVRGKVEEFRLHVNRPEVQRDEVSREEINSLLRDKSMEDPEFTQYLAGELFAGFVSFPVP